MLTQRYVELLETTARRTDLVARVMLRDVVIRSALQVAAVAALEGSAILPRPASGTVDQLPKMANRLLYEHVSDSLPLTILRECVEPLHEYIGPDAVRGLLDAITLANGRWLPSRNERAHGSLSDAMARAALDSLPDGDIRRLIEQLSPLFPNVASNGIATLTLGRVQITLDAPPLNAGEPGVFTKSARPRDGGFCLLCERCGADRAEFQRHLGPASPLVRLTLEPDRQGVWTSAQTYYVLPARSTSTFRGRAHELQVLREWLQDAGARALTILGEGGIGKTALVLEFIHHELETSPGSLPKFIVFHTAKKTRWGISGLVRLYTEGESLDDAVRAVLLAVARAMDHKPKFSPLKLRGAALINETQRFIGGLVDRSDVLLILDNAETLNERGDLGPRLNQVTSTLARVIVTSRDRAYQRLDSRPLDVPPLSNDEAVELLLGLAERLHATPLLATSKDNLSTVARRLGWRPLLIDGCVRLVAGGHIGIDQAIEKLQALAERDLGDFLYETAWRPLSGQVREVLVAVALAGGIARTEHVGWLCAALDVARTKVEKELTASYLLRVDEGGSDFLIEQLAVEWLAKKYTEFDNTARARIDDARRNVEAIAICSDRAWALLSKHERTAYRLSMAGTAAYAWDLKNWEDARLRFREALASDDSNGALWERYAAFLIDDDRPSEALVECDRAAARGGPDAEVRFTRASAFARLDRFADAHAELDAASAAGKSQEECGELHLRAIIDELESTLREARNRTEEVLRAVRLRATSYIGARIPRLEAVLKLLKDRQVVAAAMLPGDADMRHAAKLIADLDRALEWKQDKERRDS
jgi:hypothetical protein